MHRLRREMQLLASVRSRYVTQFIGAVFGPQAMMVMEYLEGGSLYHSLVCLDPLNPGMGLFSWYKRCAASPWQY